MCKIILNSDVIIESILDQDDYFWRSSLVLIGYMYEMAILDIHGPI